MKSTKATIYVWEIEQQLALGCIGRGVHIVMLTTLFVNSLPCGPPTWLAHTHYFHHQLRRGITINSSDEDFRSSCWWGCGLGVRSLFYGAFDWEHQSSIACEVVEEAALVISRGDNVNTYFSHLSRPSLEVYSIYVGGMLSFRFRVNTDRLDSTCGIQDV
jgi:hypothetical protein